MLDITIHLASQNHNEIALLPTRMDIIQKWKITSVRMWCNWKA